VSACVDHRDGTRAALARALAAVAVAALLWVAPRCAAPGRAAPAPALTGAVPIAPTALRQLAERLAATCVDSLPAGRVEELWPVSPGDSAAEASEALAGLHKTLAACSCTVFGIEPASYEALAALMALPVSVLLVVIDFPVSGPVPLARERLSAGIPPAPELDPGLLRLRAVGSVSKRGKSYALRCTDGETVSGLPSDNPVGQVYLVGAGDSEAYHQVASLFCVSSLSRFTIEAHLEEWFRMMPYTRVAPRLVDPARDTPKGADR
jgi:hypothetical protein